MDRWETGVLVTIPLLVLLIQLGNKQFKSIPEQTMFALSKIPWVRYGVGATMLMGKLGRTKVPRMGPTLRKCPDSAGSHKWLWEVYIAVPCSVPVVSNVGDSVGMDNWVTN